MEIATRKVEAMRLATYTHPGAFPAFFESEQQLPRLAVEQGLMGPTSQLLSVFTLTPPDPNGAGPMGPSAIATYCAAVMLQAGQSAKPPLEERTIAAGTFAIAMYKGPYDGLPQAWPDFFQSLAAAGHQPDPARECLQIYRNNPQTAEPEELLTELFVAIA